MRWKTGEGVAAGFAVAGAVAFHSAEEREGERDEGEGEREEERVCGEAERDGAEGDCAAAWVVEVFVGRRLDAELPACARKEFAGGGEDER